MISREKEKEDTRRIRTVFRKGKQIETSGIWIINDKNLVERHRNRDRCEKSQRT